MTRLLLLSLLLPLLAACGSTPTEIYSLSATAPRPVTPAPAGAPLIYVDQAVVADYADRSQMVTRSGAHLVTLQEFAVWSEPPGELITATLVDELATRFGDDRVLATPAALYADPDWRIELTVLRFDVDEAGQAVIDVRWALLGGRAETLAATKRQLIVTRAADPLSPASRVTALREGLAQLAAGIADSVVSFARAAREVIVVVCDEPASITDAYAMIKVLHRDYGVERFHVLANQAKGAQHGRDLFSRLARVSEKFLDVTLNYLGAVPYDDCLRKAVQKQTSVVESFPRSPSAMAFRQVAKKAMQWPVPRNMEGHLEFFIERLVNFSGQDQSV